VVHRARDSVKRHLYACSMTADEEERAGDAQTSSRSKR
jgi:hypothetical protein